MLLKQIEIGGCTDSGRDWTVGAHQIRPEEGQIDQCHKNREIIAHLENSIDFVIGNHHIPIRISYGLFQKTSALWQQIYGRV